MAEKVPLSEPISLRLPADVFDALQLVARASERPRSWIMVRALRRYIATEGVEILEAARGRTEIAGGNSHDIDDVIGEVEQELRKGSGKAA
jgi:predicted transcriptional regulator